MKSVPANALPLKRRQYSPPGFSFTEKPSDQPFNFIRHGAVIAVVRLARKPILNISPMNISNPEAVLVQKPSSCGVQVALTRSVSPHINDCQLTYMSRQLIDYNKAVDQHRAYCQILLAMGLDVVSLPETPELPDAVFVEDSALVLDEIAVLGATGVPGRRSEVHSVHEFLAKHREVVTIDAGARFEGGDAIQRGRRLYVGQSTRTCMRAIECLAEILSSYSYEVQPVRVSGCLHLSTGASYLEEDVVLVNPEWVDVAAFADCEILSVPKEEPWAANVLEVNGGILMAEGFPGTQRLLQDRGFNVLTTDISEFMKAEAGITCLTNILSVNLR